MKLEMHGVERRDVLAQMRCTNLWLRNVFFQFLKSFKVVAGIINPLSLYTIANNINKLKLKLRYQVGGQ